MGRGAAHHDYREPPEFPSLWNGPIAPRVCTSKGRVDIWNLNKDDITVAIAPHAGGAAGTLTYFAAPLAGAKTVMLEEFSPDGALALIEKEKATAIGVVPTHLVRMLDADTSKYDLELASFYPFGRRLSFPPDRRGSREGFRRFHHQRSGHPGHGVGVRMPR